MRLPLRRSIFRVAPGAQVFLLALAGIFGIYDLYQTAYVPLGLGRDGIFSDTDRFLFGLGSGHLAAATFLGLFIGAKASHRLPPVRTTADIWGAGRLQHHDVGDGHAGDGGRHLHLPHACRYRAWIELVTIDAYMVEIVPKQYGKAAAIIMPFLLRASAARCSPIYSSRLILGYRRMALARADRRSGIIAVWWRMRLPGSPRWLAHRGVTEAAERILARSGRIEAELGRNLPLPEPSARSSITKRHCRDLAAAPPLTHDHAMVFNLSDHRILQFHQLAADAAGGAEAFP